MNLFEELNQQEAKQTFISFIQRKDKKGMINYLNKLSQKELSEEVLKAGYSMISFKKSKESVIKHIFNQVL